MTKVPDFSPAKWEKCLKDKNYAEDRVESLEDELDKALDEQEKQSHHCEELRGERDAEKRLRVQAENDARRAKAAADQAAAAAAAASRSLKIGEKQGAIGGAKEGGVQELRVELHQLKAKNHGLNTQLDALATDHERVSELLVLSKKDKVSASDEASELRRVIAGFERTKEEMGVDAQAKALEMKALASTAETAREEAARLEAQNHRLGDELDRLAGSATGKKNAGKDTLAADLKAAKKAQEDAVQHSTMVETQLSALQTELRAAREEVASNNEESEMKAEAAREGVMVADTQAAALAKETTSLRAELTALREETVPASAEQAKLLASREKELETLKAKVTELDALREEAVSLRGQGETEREGAEKKAAASAARAEQLEEDLSESKREGTADRLAEMTARVTAADTAKQMVVEELAAKNDKIERLELRVAAAANGGVYNGERSLEGFGGEPNGDGSVEKIVALEKELDDTRAMLDSASSERDTAVSDLQKTQKVEGGSRAVEGGGGQGEEGQEELLRLRQECKMLREQLGGLEKEQGDEEIATSGPKRVKALEDQLERLSFEHTRQAESWRVTSSQMETDREELSQELISAKLQVAQLFMEVDGLKLQHRHETIAATIAHAQEIESFNSPSPGSGGASRSPPPSSTPKPSSPNSLLSPISPCAPPSPSSPFKIHL